VQLDAVGVVDLLHDLLLVWASGLRDWGSGFRFQDLGFRVWALRYIV
jgi:hypothetical protein